MARKTRGRRKPYQKYNSAFQAIPISSGVNLGTLADETAALVNLISIADDFWCQSIDGAWSIVNHTVGEGPLLVGYASGDLSAAEVGEAINATPTARSDIINRERARRPVRRVGVFPGIQADDVLNDGKVLRTTLKMYLAEGVDLNMFVFNASGSALATGAFCQVYGTLFGEWK